MMRRQLDGLGIPIVVCQDRHKAGQEALRSCGARVIILDDGFQHWRLSRDLDIVLVNATDPFGGGSLLPLGNLREPEKALGRAGLIVITHADRLEAAGLSQLRERLRKLNSKAPVLEAVHRPDFLLELKTQKKEPFNCLCGRKVTALSGIADPTSLEDKLTEIGCMISQKWHYPDHHPYTLTELESAEHLRAGLPLVTTLKDFTRFPEGWERAISSEAYALAMRLEIVKGQEEWSSSLTAIAGGRPR
jgi:tetraacyldisaccharide 4'-kinase